MSIYQNVKEILSGLPRDVLLVAAAKTRTVDEVREAVDAGVMAIGENYIQEAVLVNQQIGGVVKWHCIGHLQKNKVKKAVAIFDMIETVDTFSLAEEIDRRCDEIDKKIDVLIEINSAEEKQKSGVYPIDVLSLVKGISTLKNVQIKGLMTMGPFLDNPEEIRPYFKITKSIFDKLQDMDLPNVEMKFLSMGMSDSYNVAIEEGANIVRVGTKLFGDRNK